MDGFGKVGQRGRLAHSYLFVGPAGVGKKLFANELGKALLCETNNGAGGLQACDRCTSCTLVGAGTHPDFIAVAFETILGTSPNQDELVTCLDSLVALRAALNDLKEPDRTKRARLQLVQALLNHNDFVTVR